MSPPPGCGPDAAGTPAPERSGEAPGAPDAGYDVLWTVDLTDNSYSTLRADGGDPGPGGEDFFADAGRTILERVPPEERPFARGVFRREALLAALEEEPVLSFTCRLRRGGVLRCCRVRFRREAASGRLLAALLPGDGLRARAGRDALTGAMDRNAFSLEEALWDRRVRAGEPVRFAVAVFDVNGLKKVNDARGHRAGDALLLEAARLIGACFSGSPVFRIGGDEFAAVLTGTDREDRAALLAELEARVRRGGVSLAAGLAAWQADRDRTFGDVFRRADARMYEKKRAMKLARDP